MVTGHDVSFLAALLAGLLSFLSPCTLPLFPSFLSFVAGVSFEDLQTPLASTTKMATTGVSLLLAYSLGMAIPFIASALAFSRFLTLFDRYKRSCPPSASSAASS